MLFQIKSKKKYSCVLDDEKMATANLQKSCFPFKKNDLIEHCQEILERKIGLVNSDDLDDSFQFIFPVIGPLSKDKYIKQVQGFHLETSFPDIYKNLYYHFNIDPYEPNRVWFTSRLITNHQHDGPLGKATFKKIDCPPQMNSLTFNADGKVTKYTGGYVMDKTIGNTGGLGGLFGILYAIEQPLPFPEAQPYRKSFMFRFFEFQLNIIEWCYQYLKLQK